jgi:hypothetical protein
MSKKLKPFRIVAPLIDFVVDFKGMEEVPRGAHRFKIVRPDEDEQAS